MEDKGLRIGKRKRGIPQSLQNQTDQESTNRDGAVTKATKDPDTEVGMTVRSTAREHGKQRENKERVIGWDEETVEPKEAHTRHAMGVSNTGV